MSGSSRTNRSARARLILSTSILLSVLLYSAKICRGLVCRVALPTPWACCCVVFIPGMMDGGQMQQMLLSVSEQILYNIKQEYKRLQKRRHLDSIYQHVDSCSPLDLQNIQSGSTLPGNFSWLPLKRDTAEWMAALFFFFLSFQRVPHICIHCTD